jgi:pimeloyl-ACP methyl ester carboxylesterase
MRLRALAALSTLLFVSVAVAASRSNLELTDCRLESPAGPGIVAARCGWLEVPENRAAPQAKKIRLHVALIPALSLKPVTDPLFVLAGGPGQAAADFYLSVSPAFARVRRDRDIVLVDQRGTGRSNRLDCNYPDDAELAAIDDALLQTQTRACLGALPGDPRYYTTSVAVRDLDEVRAALGYIKVNLYGVSYGTRVAQHYLRRYPERVRAVILDGAVPVDLALGPDVAPDAQHALDALFERCTGDAACAAAFPRIREQFETLRARLERQPIAMHVADPIDARISSTTFGMAHLSSAVRLLTYSDETASVLPLLIHEANTEGRAHALAAQYLMIKRSTQSQLAYGMQYAVVCSEDVPRWTSSAVAEAQRAGTYIGNAFTQGLQAICDAWPRGEVDADFNAPLHSDVPVLILSGGNDPVTPASYGERVLAGFTAGRHLVLAGQGHGQLATGCVPLLAATFIGAASTQALQVDCLKNVSPAPFMLSQSATSP